MHAKVVCIKPQFVLENVMLNLEIKSVGKGTCCWCGRAKDEILTVSFTDKSFSGAMCWSDLRRALRMKLHDNPSTMHPDNNEQPRNCPVSSSQSK